MFEVTITKENIETTEKFLPDIIALLNNKGADFCVIALITQILVDGLNQAKLKLRATEENNGENSIHS